MGYYIILTKIVNFTLGEYIDISYYNFRLNNTKQHLKKKEIKRR